MKETKSEWDRLLREKTNLDGDIEFNDAKEILESQRQKDRERLLEIVRGMILNKREDGCWVNENTFMSADLYRRAEGYNQCLSDLEQVIIS